MPDAAPEPQHPRCRVCGMWHPHVQVCAYIAEQEIREEFVSDGRRRRLAARIVRTRYFPRPEIAAASVASLEDDAGTEVEAHEADAGGANGAPAPGALEADRAG